MKLKQHKNFIEHFIYDKCSDKKMKLNNSIRQLQYTRLNLPIKLQLFLDHLVKRLFLSKIPGKFEIMDYLDVNMKVDKMDNVRWLINMRIYEKCSVSTHKIFLEFWMMKDEYFLKSFRFYQLKDNHPFKFNDKLIGLHNKRCHLNEVVGITNSVLEMNDTSGIKPDPDGKQAPSAVYNKWIIPRQINPSNSYVTFTPDFYQTHYNDSQQMFAQTLGMPGFPNAHATGGK
jgi:hypothetical protein